MSNSMADTSVDWPGRWNHILKLITRGGPFARPDFEPNPEVTLIVNIINNIMFEVSNASIRWV